jgi:hypothetical protein
MKRALWVCLWILCTTLVCSAQTTFYFPHIADGILGGTKWKTTILLTNSASSGTASGTITFTKDNCPPGAPCGPVNLAASGSLFTSVSFSDETGAPAGSGGTITFSIGPGQAKKYTSSGSGPYSGGFATVKTTAGTVFGTSIFSEFTLGDLLIAEAGVQSSAALQNQSIFVDTQGGFNIGFAYSNVSSSTASPASASLTLTMFDTAAAMVGTPQPQTMGSGNHNAIFLTDLFANVPNVNLSNFVGTLQIKSTVPMGVVALRFDRTFSVFTTLPPAPLASLINPLMNWFDQRQWAPMTTIARLLGAFQLRVG